MNASADHIRQALEAVAHYRQERAAHAPLAEANAEIKRFQARRFQSTYPDLLNSPRYKSAARFFLVELYGEKDYAERDQQFARIAGTIAKLFPQMVVNTAAALADVHALTERLDDLMARCWMASATEQPDLSKEARYIQCWRAVPDAAARQQQLRVVLALGKSLNDLTRKPGLRTLLKMMRGPATAAGLASLQKFLESGFDAFAEMRGADEFLTLIDERETQWMRCLFNEDAVACETKLVELFAGAAPI
jgi:hypothetical protein